jgi:hypothetical protein
LYLLWGLDQKWCSGKEENTAGEDKQKFEEDTFQNKKNTPKNPAVFQ